jgi:hypothetical protein
MRIHDRSGLHGSGDDEGADGSSGGPRTLIAVMLLAAIVAIGIGLAVKHRAAAPHEAVSTPSRDTPAPTSPSTRPGEPSTPPPSPDPGPDPAVPATDGRVPTPKPKPFATTIPSNPESTPAGTAASVPAPRQHRIASAVPSNPESTPAATAAPVPAPRQQRIAIAVPSNPKPTPAATAAPAALPVAEQFSLIAYSRTHVIEDGLHFPFDDPVLGQLADGDIRAQVAFNGPTPPKGRLTLEWLFDGISPGQKPVAPNALVAYGSEPAAGTYRIVLRLNQTVLKTLTFRITPLRKGSAAQGNHPQ